MSTNWGNRLREIVSRVSGEALREEGLELINLFEQRITAAQEEAAGSAGTPERSPVSAVPQLDAWLVWSHEHHAYWPRSRRGYVPLHEAGIFSLDEALEIVHNGNQGMRAGCPEETMMPVDNTVKYFLGLLSK